MKFSTPTKVDAVQSVFGGSVRDLMPIYSSIPNEFKSRASKWVAWQQKWFYSGLDAFPEAQEGIDAKDAARHLKAIMTSWEPKHEHKEAAVAYLASLWLKEPT